ncbi:MAG: GGDEF domain-containing protein, partial [Paraglaciecola sp.]|nr:GGDEF domain-containing protein [Paraglaciecola sp.]
MAVVTLNKSIFRLVVGTVLFTTVGVLVSMWATTSSHAQKQLNRNLNVAQNVLTQVLASREQQLYISANALTLDFPFRSAVATRDEATIQSVLQNHGDRIEADLMALISLDGQLISSTNDALEKNTSFAYPDFIKST